MNIAALKAEIDADPAALGYAGKSDAAIADALNEASQPAVVSVRSIDVKRKLLLAGKWPGIVIAARASNPAAVNITEALATFETFDMTDATYLAAITAGLDALVQAGLITAENRADVLTLQAGTRSRAAALGLPAVHHLDVAGARK